MVKKSLTRLKLRFGMFCSGHKLDHFGKKKTVYMEASRRMGFCENYQQSQDLCLYFFVTLLRSLQEKD